MCGILGVVARTPVNQLLYDGLLVLQHRGQDAAGIVTADGANFHSHRGMGMVRDVFRTRDMRALAGQAGIAHTRYPTAGSATSAAESQPFYVNSPFGIVLAHNGNLTNTEQLKVDLFRTDLRHVNTNSDSEVLLNVLAHELQEAATNYKLEPAAIFAAVSGVHRRCRGAYAVVAMIAGYGMLAFRDPYGIRPLIFGRIETDNGYEYMMASESVALDAMGYEVVRDVAPARRFLSTWTAIFIAASARRSHRSIRAYSNLYIWHGRFGDRRHLGVRNTAAHGREPCRQDQPQVPASRYRCGDTDSRFEPPCGDGVVETAQPAVSRRFHQKPLHRRTFIMPGQAVRRKSVRQKLNAIGMEFKGKDVLLVDDSIVRGTTSSEIVQMARDAGARKVYFASAAPPVRFANVYGIDMPTRDELIANGRSDEEIAREIGCDELIYQDLDALIEDVHSVNPRVKSFEASCFNGIYITGDITREYLDGVEQQRRDGVKLATSAAAATQLDLDLELVE
jgi:amidophosphoribosyltransferase